MQKGKGKYGEEMRFAGVPPHKAKQRRLTAVCAAAALLLQHRHPERSALSRCHHQCKLLGLLDTPFSKESKNSTEYDQSFLHITISELLPTLSRV